MRRIIVIAAAGLSLAGCASFSSAFKSTPPDVAVQLESLPSGADALASSGQGCKTPCALKVPPGDFTVTFTMDKFQPVTIPVQVVVTPGDFTTPESVTVTPNPVVAELQPVRPVRKHKSAVKRVKKPKPAAAAPTQPSPFPAPPPPR